MAPGRTLKKGDHLLELGPQPKGLDDPHEPMQAGCQRQQLAWRPKVDVREERNGASDREQHSDDDAEAPASLGTVDAAPRVVVEVAAARSFGWRVAQAA